MADNCLSVNRMLDIRISDNRESVDCDYSIKEYFFIFEKKWAGGHQKFPGPGFNANPPLSLSNTDVFMRG